MSAIRHQLERPNKNQTMQLKATPSPRYIAPDVVIETSWEVCNKIGGIYTVLSTKAEVMRKEFNDQAIFIGPDVWTSENPSPYFREDRILLAGWASKPMLPEGVDVRIGRWLVPGRPIAILVKFDGMYRLKDKTYGDMWSDFGVDSLHAYGDYDEACAFSMAAGKVVESLAAYFRNKYNKKLLGLPKIVAHFDEWTTGMGLLYIKKRLPWVSTVFTTHATSIGRSICSNGKELYKYLYQYEGDVMARELNMESKHSLEKAAAKNADVFTTVSEVTADECEQLLGKRPMVTPNGFERAFVPKGQIMIRNRSTARKKITEVAAALTGKKYSKPFIIITSGRGEYRNKGLDIFLDSMATIRWQLSHKAVGNAVTYGSEQYLKRNNAPEEIIALVMVPGWTAGPREDLYSRMSAGETASGAPLSNPWTTHRLHAEEGDLIARKIKATGLDGIDPNPATSVTVIYVPSYLNGDDGIFNLPYYHLLSGADITAFPSYYEPWGYTPLESVAFGIPTITTTLSGFGQWVKKAFDNATGHSGVNLVTRNDENYSTAVHVLSDALLSHYYSTKGERRAVSREARETSDMAQWESFINYYYEAYTNALLITASRYPLLKKKIKNSLKTDINKI